MTHDRNRLLTEDEAIEYFNETLGLPIAKITLQRRRKDGTGPKYIRVGNRPLFRVRDLHAYLDDQPTYTATSQEPAA